MARKYAIYSTGVKLPKIGGAKAAKELGIPEGTIHTWLKAVEQEAGYRGRLPYSRQRNDLSEGLPAAQPGEGQDTEIRRLNPENEFLEEASAFFAASRRKSVKTRE